MGAFGSCRNPGTRPLCEQEKSFSGFAMRPLPRTINFGADDLSILDQAVIDHARVHGPKQVTDLYLLALAVKNTGRFVTFDGAVPLSAVHRAEEKHLTVI